MKAPLSRALPLAAALTAAAASVPAEGTEDAYLFTYFINEARDGLHLAVSDDGLAFESLTAGRGALIEPRLGWRPVMRDPCIARGPDGVFHLVWTTGWGAPGFGHASSADLVRWSEQKQVPAMAHEPGALNCWAPDLTWDGERGRFLIFWATTIPGRFHETGGTGDLDGRHRLNHRIYWTATEDFETFEPTRLFFEPGFNVIDSTVFRDGDRWAMVYKTETRWPAAKHLGIAFASDVEGPWGTDGGRITGNFWAEGPTVARVGNDWVVYFDKYAAGAYGAVRSSDLRTWEDVSSRVSFPAGARHGTVLRVDQAFAKGLRERLVEGSVSAPRSP